MKLKNAARYFDNDSVTDGYSGAFLFKAQFSSYDGASPDGSFNRRRTVSVAPGIAPAPRRVVEVQGAKWVMGELVTDTFKDKAIRQTAAAKEVTDLFQLRTPGQAALRQPGTPIYAHRVHLKDTVNSTTDSAYDPQYEVFFAIVETIKQGQFLSSSNITLHVRSVQLANEGYWVATSDELSREPSTSLEVYVTLGGTFDPLTETYTTSITTTGLLLDMYKLYEYNTQADPRAQAGDKTLILAKSAMTPTPDQTLTIAGVKWRNIKFTEYHDAWNLQIRRA